MVSVPQNRSFPIYGLSPIGSHCVPMGLNPSQLPFVLEGAVKIDILKSRKGIGEPPNGPSGPRRECAVQAFSPQVKTLAEGRLCRPRAFKYRRVEPPFGRRNPKQKDILTDVLLFWRRERDSNPRTGISRYTISNRAPSTSSAISPNGCCPWSLVTAKIIIPDFFPPSSFF